MSRLSTLYATYVEGIPFFQFHPGAAVLAIGTTGCTLDCSYCMNRHLLRGPNLAYDLTPQQVVDKALAADARVISFSANEPAVDFKLFMDIARAAADAGLMTGCSTNGLFSEAQLGELCAHVDCVNVSYKGPDREFYREVCRGGSPEKVLHTIGALTEAGVHVEVTTPYVPQFSRETMLFMAENLAAVDRRIPWHVFRLLAEYRLEGARETSIDEMEALRDEAAEMLPYIYLENFATSPWLDTRCPECGALLVRRMGRGGCGGDLFDVDLVDGCCPRCSRRADIRGDIHVPGEENVLPDPRRALIDVGGWQNTVSMATGLGETGPVPDGLGELLAAHPYPGDMTPESDAWVTDLALDALKESQPDLVTLAYAQCSFVARHRYNEYDAYVEHLEHAVDRFVAESGYEPVIVGLGDMAPCRGVLDMEGRISGVASADDGLACLYGANAHEADSLRKLEGVERVLARQEMEDLIGEPLDGYGDWFVLPEEGWQMLVFSSSSGRVQEALPAISSSLPVWAPFAVPDTLAELRGAVLNRVAAGRKVALIVCEGVGMDRFPFGGPELQQVSAPVIAAGTPHLYMILATGRVLHPRCMAYAHWTSPRRTNPFARSYPFLQDSLVQQVAGETLSVGNRSQLTHAAFPADLSLECHCASLHRFGAMGVFK